MTSQRPHSEARQLASFASLPYELRARIINKSYQVYNMKSEAMINLMLVSRDVYALVAPTWYRAVRITRPSTLASFLQAVFAKPALGQLVTSLWLGPKVLLPQSWWPLGPLHGPDEAFEERHIATSLSDERLLPRGCSSRHRWRLADLTSDGVSRRDKAVLEAIEVAQEFIGVDLKRPRYAPGGSKIGSMLWLIGVVEAQAVLDLYLLEVRRLEDEAKGSKPGSEEGESDGAVEYPTVELMTAIPPAEDNKRDKAGRFTLHRSKLVQYMTQRGGPADFFDHPVLFARSGIKTISFTPQGRGKLSKELWQQAEAIYEEEDDAFGSLALQDSGATTLLPQDLANPLDPANLATVSVGGNIHLSRLLLSLTPNVQNLVLTGSPQRILCGRGASYPPQALRYFCLGPLFPLADQSLSPCHEGGRLTGLREIRLRGTLVGDQKRACIRALPSLKRADWDLQHAKEDLKALINAFKPLVDEARSATATHRKGKQRKRRRAASDDSQSPAQSTFSDSSAQTSEDANSTAAPLPPKIFIGVGPRCEAELPKHFDEDAVDKWDHDASVYTRPWRIRIWYSSSHGEYAARDEKKRTDLATREVTRAYDDVRTWWSLLSHYKPGRRSDGG